VNERSSQAGRGLWAVWFVAAALIALVAVPAYLGRRVAEVQTRITEVLEVAGGLSSRLTLLKSQQMGRFEVYALTGDRSYRDPYAAGIAEEDTLFAQLTALAEDLDFDVRTRLAALPSQSTSWHLENLRAFDADSIGEGALASSRRRFEELQRATVALDRAIQAEVAEGRLAMQAATALQSRLTFGLGILALAATMLVARVGFRLRDLGEEAESGRSDAELARSQTAAVLEATDDGVLGIDKYGLCTSLNHAGAQLLGWRERDVLGRNVHDMLFHTAADGMPHARGDSQVLAALAEGRALDSSDGAVIAGKNGVFPARWSLRPLRDGDELQGAVLTFMDMTAIREHEAALRRAIEQRDEVVSIVSHDLRNPLGVVLAASDLLLDLPLEEAERRRQLEIIQRSGRRMQTLIEDLLDVARIEAGAFVVRPSIEDVDPILEEARALFADQAERRAVKLTVRADGAGTRARVDRDRILQALANLLDNALRVTPEGGAVEIGRREEQDRLVITVSDTGPGIPESMQARLFQRFTQSKSQRGGGAGLGLAIVRGVAEAHGGSVGVRTEVGAGTTFEIRLPRV
jgi:PAS domain S-box-containing protein